ncbi:conserved hypothetical protein [Methylobacterium sp. 4-46]|uniref:YybH family protein n=1 Tax=unclassified Methylobacterium TaxID=2615210 RepID=UPI000152C1E9|nr:MULTISPECIES: DUF4440 domain-containing protein [Methylobacterium]ACA19065.1 conserved hypothetical protein [Methylobacterium sp. 4-46]WFT78278.1 DUF4440 domain-containing protein [Methylobacterium nodulans]
MRAPTLATALFLLAGHALAQDKAAIDKLNAEFESAFRSGNFSAVANMYTEDAYVLPSGSPLVHGRAEVQKFWTEAGKVITDIKLTTLDVQPLGGEAAREVGRFVLKLKDQSAQDASGKYVVVWRKVGNDWKLSTDIWNSDK